MARNLSRTAPRGQAFHSPTRLVRLFCLALLFTLTVALVITLFSSGSASSPVSGGGWTNRAPKLFAPSQQASDRDPRDGRIATEEERRGGWEEALQRKAAAAAERKQAERPPETRSPPALSLPGVSRSASPPSLGSLAKTDPLATAYSSALSELSSAVLRLVDHHSDLSSEPFQERVVGFPGTAIESREDAAQVQDWLNCEASEGEYRFEPTGKGPNLTVHKQGKAEAGCDQAFYKGREPASTGKEWDVRPSLKFQWRSSPRCDPLRPKRLASTPSLSRRNLCRLLKHKAVLMVGDGATSYSMHDLLLDWTNTRPATCYGDSYCKEHGMCGKELDEDQDGDQAKVDRWEVDERVYVKLPGQPQPAKVAKRQTHDEDKAGILGGAPPVPPVATVDAPHAPQDEEEEDQDASLIEDAEAPSPSQAPALPPSPPPPRGPAKGDTYSQPKGTIFRYRRSDGLWGSTHSVHGRFGHTFVHPSHGRREVNNYWLPDSRRHDLVILSRPPMPLPRSSHLGSVFSRSKDVTPSDYIHLSSTSSPSSTSFTDLSKLKGRAARVALVEMAKRVTLEVWLPEVVFTLVNVRAPPSPADQLVVWRSEWRVQPSCADGASTPSSPSTHDDDFDWQSWWAARGKGDGSAPVSTLPPTLVDLLDGSDVRASFHNLQVVFQNYLLKKLLPAFGIAFLDLESGTSVWRSGMVGGSSAPTTPVRTGLVDQAAGGKGKRSPSTGKDCLRYCFPSPGGALEHGFIGGLVRLLEAGWGEDTDWVGDEFVPVRQRKADKGKA